jgi:hypothetical protein
MASEPYLVVIDLQMEQNLGVDKQELMMRTSMLSNGEEQLLSKRSELWVRCITVTEFLHDAEYDLL